MIRAYHILDVTKVKSKDSKLNQIVKVIIYYYYIINIYIYSKIKYILFINLATRSNKKSETKNPQKRKAASISTKEKRLHHDQITSEVMVEMVSNRNNEVRVENLESSSANIELEERKLALLERQVKLRKEAAEAEAIELKNQQLKMSLGLAS